MSAATVDATNKNESFRSSHKMTSGTVATRSIRLSQAFIVQTADHTYKTLPKA